MNLEACLPTELRTPTTTITQIAAGLSGAGVHRVDANGGTFVLKISSDEEPIADWRHKREVQQQAAAAGLAPRVLHVDDTRRAVVTAFVVDRSFPARFGDPRTREAAIVQLGQTARGIHDLALPPGMTARSPRDFLASLGSALAGFAVPPFVTDAIARMLAEDAPPRQRDLVLSHNDVNPSNLVYDGEHLMLLDWDAAGPNDPFFDLATIAVFLRMDDDTCRKLLAAHDGAPVTTVPAGFAYYRRLVAVLCGSMFVHLARLRGHAGATGETLESTPSLADIYQRMRSRTLDIAGADGQWCFGLALVKAGVELRTMPERS